MTTESYLIFCLSYGHQQSKAKIKGKKKRKGNNRKSKTFNLEGKLENVS